jgi:hypothetical protein
MLKSHVKDVHIESDKLLVGEKTVYIEPNKLLVGGKHLTSLKNIDKCEEWWEAFSLFKAVFFHIARIKFNHIHSCILYVGPENEARNHKYRIRIAKPDGSGIVSAYYETKWYLNDVEEALLRGNCAVFPHEFSKNYMAKEKNLSLEIEVSEVLTDSWDEIICGRK